MNKQTKYKGKNNLKSAQIYVKKQGKDNLCNFLKRHLYINNFDDKKGSAYLFLLSLNCYFYYTTNQDNIFELCLDKYNRKYNIVTDIESFKSVNPNHTTLYKYHGTLEKPETVVFSTADYNKRLMLSKNIRNFNPLDIRLLSDSISKSIFFIGYSFRDPNVIELFKHIYKLFNKNPPESYLLEYIHDNNFARKLKNKFGIQCINGFDLFPQLTNPNNVFQEVLLYIGHKVLDIRHANEMNDLLTENNFNIIPIITSYEIDNFNNYIKTTTNSIKEKIKKFRATFDARNIPKDEEKIVQSILIKLMNETTTKDDILEIKGSIFNLYLNNIECLLYILAEYYYMTRHFSSSEPFEVISLMTINANKIHSKYQIFHIARAIDLMFERDKKINKNFLSNLTFLCLSDADLTDIDNKAADYIRNQFNRAYISCREYTNPLKGRNKIKMSSVRFEDILGNINATLPKKFKNLPKQ